METLRSGSRGPSVELLQLALLRAGFDPKGIDGIFGPNTKAALQRFQKSVGLTADGIAGVRTWPRLLDYIKGYMVYTIKPGDTFWALAKRFNTDLDAILAANPNAVPTNLQIGQQVIIPLSFPIVPTNIRFTSTVLSLVLEGLSYRYPFIKVGTIGKSVLGRDLYAVSVGTGRTQVFYNASHHANEWITTPLLLKFLEEYAAAYTAGGQVAGISAQRLFRNCTLLMVPMVNPDGVDLVTGSLPVSGTAYTNAKRLAANYPDIPFPNGWKANAVGVDLNLQYPAGWERAKEIKFSQGYTKPGPRDFVGTAPLTEPEAQAMARFTQAYRFRLTISYHTQGKEIFWRYLDAAPRNSREIARAFARVSGYRLADPPAVSQHAGYKDWFIDTFDRPGFTIEAGSGESPLPLSQFDTIYRDNIGILTLGMALPSGTQ